MSGLIVENLKARGLHDAAAAIALEEHVTVGDMLGRSRLKGIARARHRFWLHLRDLGLSYPAIALLCDVDHTTVMAGVRKAGARRFAA